MKYAVRLPIDFSAPIPKDAVRISHLSEVEGIRTGRQTYAESSCRTMKRHKAMKVDKDTRALKGAKTPVRQSCNAELCVLVRGGDATFPSVR